jgi:hypothetical protein
MLDLTTTFRNISTAKGRAGAEAAQAAAAHLRYIDRGTAVEDRASSGLANGSPAEQRAAMRQRFRSAGEQGGKSGKRVAEKLIVSLPNSWPREARREALERLCEHLAPPGSDAVAYGTTHSDKSHNRHLHIVAQDGAESREQAKARRRASARAWLRENAGKKPRLRRQNVIRLGEKTRAKELRAEIAGILNEVAEKRGIEGVEHRSFKDREIGGPATVHEGASVRAVAEKTGQDPTGRIEANKRIRSARELSLFSSTAISQPIDDLFGDSTESPAAKKKADDWEARFNKEELRRIKIREAAERMRQQTHKTQRVRKKSRQIVR